MQTYYIIIWGGFNCGKTQFIQSVSDLGPNDIPQTSLRFYDRGVAGVETYHTSVNHGRINIDEDLCLYLVEIGGSFFYEQLFRLEEDNPEILGMILMVESIDPFWFQQSKYFLDLYRIYGPEPLPYIIVTTKQEHPDAWSLEDLKIVYQVSKGEKFLACNPGDRESVKRVLLELLEIVKTTSSGADWLTNICNRHR